MITPPTAVRRQRDGRLFQLRWVPDLDGPYTFVPGQYNHCSVRLGSDGKAYVQEVNPSNGAPRGYAARHCTLKSALAMLGWDIVPQ